MLEIVVRLLRSERVTFDGRYYQVRDAVLAPPPERRIPILVAAKGPRMLRLTARQADAWNTAWFGHPDDQLRERLRDLEAALAAVGRDPAEVELTVGLIVRDESVAELTELVASYEELGFGHAIVILEPRTAGAIERLAEAVRLSRK
jgi:alkanesulfonate monooxygenase SsuD/methylene tetrahydromethanopterin reductase-like flavin-dependent oxidoreductase (luciferase family)